MPGPLTIPIIAAGSSILGQGITAYAQGRMNKKTRQWNQKMYEYQRRDSLADWAMQNEYNSPRAQMERLRAAGLNPNLVYGEGAAMSNAGSVNKSDTGQWNPRSPEVNLAEPVSGFLDARIKQQTADNLTATNTVILQEALLKAINVKQAGVELKDKELDFKLKDNLQDVYKQTKQALLDKTLNEISLMSNRDIRETIAQDQSILESMERIAVMQLGREKAQEEIKLLRQDQELKELDLRLKREGINPNDPVYLRLLAQQIKKWFPSFR